LTTVIASFFSVRFAQRSFSMPVYVGSPVAETSSSHGASFKGVLLLMALSVQQFRILVNGDFDLPEYFPQQWAGNGPAGVMGNGCGSAVRVTIKSMAPFLTGLLEPDGEQEPLKVFGVNNGELGHAAT
jgi:hypothetical protein